MGHRIYVRTFRSREALLEMRNLRNHWSTGGSASGAMIPLERVEDSIRAIRANLEAHMGD